MQKRNVKKVNRTMGSRSVNTRAKVVTDAPKMVSFGRAISNFFKKYFKFNGVATRAEYWWSMLFICIVALGLMTAAWFLQPVNLLMAGFVAMLWLLFCVIIIVPLWSIMARRLHDIGITAKLLWINFVFFVCSMVIPHIMPDVVFMDWVNFGWGMVMFVLSVLPSKIQNNPYRD